MTAKKKQTIFSPLKFWLILPVFVLALYGAYLSFRWALADVLSVQVRYQIGKAQTVGQSMDIAQWRLSREMLEKTQLLNPHYSDYLDMAKLFFQVAGAQKTDLLAALNWPNAKETALDYARKAVLSRPSWPYFWNELIQMKAALNQFDGEMSGALERAMSLGTWEEPVLYDIANMGLDHWEKLPAAAHQWVILAVDKTLIVLSAEPAVVKAIQTHANIGKICPHVGEFPGGSIKRLRYLCAHLPLG